MDEPQPTADAQREPSPPSVVRPARGFVICRRLGWALGLSVLGALATVLCALPLLLTEECGPEPDPLAEAKPEPAEGPELPRVRTRPRVAVDPITVKQLSFSSDGRLLLAEYDRPFDPAQEDSVKRLSLWDVKSGQEVWTLRVPPDDPRGAMWVPGTHHLILTQWDGRVSLWDADRGPPRRGKRPLFVFGEPSEVGNTPVAISSDGRRALVVSPEGNYVLDLVKRKLLCSLYGAEGVVGGGDFSPDGKLAIGVFRPYVGSDGAALWDAEVGNALHVWPRGLGWSPGPFAPDGKHFLARRWGDGPRLEVLTDVQSGKERWSIPDEGILDAFTTDGKGLLVLRKTGLLRVNLASGKRISVWEQPIDGSGFHHPTSFAFSPDRSLLAIARGYCRGADVGTIWVELWDATRGKKLRTLVEIKEPD